MKKVTILSFATALVVCPSVGFSQVYKCVGNNGKIEFSDKACSSDRGASRVNLHDNTLSNAGEREQKLLRENQELRTQLENAARNPPSNSYGRTDADLQAERIDTRACEAAKRDLEIAAGSLKKETAVIQARRSAMYGACGMQEPNVTIIRPERAYQDQPSRPCIGVRDFNCVR